jgi:hypothetical protein
VLVRQRVRDALWLALWMIVLAYTSWYSLVFATVMIAVAILARPGDWMRRPLRIAALCALSATVAAVAVVPLSIPYRRVAIEQGLVRTLGGVGQFSATLKGYVASPGRLHFYAWDDNAFRSEIEAFFPGVAVTALSIAAVVLVLRREGPRHGADPSLTRRRVAMLVAVAAAGLILSLGTNTPVYGWVYSVFPPLHVIRAAARFGNLFLLAVALLAAIGIARLRSFGAFGRHATALTIAIIVIIHAEALRAPFEYTRFGGIPNLYSILAREPGRVVLVEQPFYHPQTIFQNAEYVLNSTAHWRALVNGYSGYTPKSYRDHAETFWFFPRDHAIQAMRQAGVTHVMVHPRRFHADAAEMQEMVLASPHLERIAVGRDEMTLYRLR